MVNSHYLPQEILVEIFSYLPTKSIGKCRCLSKTWNTSLSNSLFINLHLTRKTHNQQNLIVISKSGFLQITTTSIKNDKSRYPYSISLSPSITQLSNGWTKFMGSCNGLVLLLKKNNAFVVNPVTCQQVAMPEPPSILTGYEHKTMYGFGYDRSSDDFKVVALSPLSNRFEKYTVDVYSMKTRVWRTVGYSPYYECYEPFMPFVNGVMHWLIRDEFGCNHIGAFDLATESFPEILLPKVFGESYIITKIAVLQGCLTIVDYGASSACAWVMKEYRVEDSPVRLHVDKTVSWSASKPVAFIGNEKILCFTTIWERLLLCGLKIVHHKFASQTDSFCLGSIVFEESIVSPEQEAVSS